MSKLQNVRAYLTGEGISHVDIEFENGIITSISPAKEGDVSSLPEDAVVLPGFIDQHVHGAGGADTMDATPEALACISQTLAKEGTVAFLATTMTQSPEAITRALENVRDSFAKCTGASPIGVHLEGPFISPRYIGAQPPEYVAVADTEVFDTYCRIRRQDPSGHRSTRGKGRECLYLPSFKKRYQSIGWTFCRRIRANRIGDCKRSFLCDAYL